MPNRSYWWYIAGRFFFTAPGPLQDLDERRVEPDPDAAGRRHHALAAALALADDGRGGDVAALEFVDEPVALGVDEVRARRRGPSR